MDLIMSVPDYLQKNMFDWMEEIKEKYNIQKEHVCPICHEVFNNKFNVRKHLIKENDKEHSNYYKAQIKFIKKMLRKHGFSVKWIYRHEGYLLFSISWIWTFWKENYERGIQKTLFGIFKTRRKNRIKKM
jgi:hypothetical protein